MAIDSFSTLPLQGIGATAPVARRIVQPAPSIQHSSDTLSDTLRRQLRDLEARLAGTFGLRSQDVENISAQIDALKTRLMAANPGGRGVFLNETA